METSITYFNEKTSQEVTQSLEEATIFVTWEQIDARRWLLADDFGKLYFLMLVIADGGKVTGWKLDILGDTSCASCLVYLDNGFVFVGSHRGDSQVIKIEEGGIRLIQTISNIAPILDLTVMDMGGRGITGQINEYSSGQARIVTGSGAFQDGSLRSIRSGVGMEEHGLLGEMNHITDLFSLRSASSMRYVDLLFVSFVDETRVFHFNVDGEVEEKPEYLSVSLTESTIYAANLSHNHLLQVTGSSTRLIDLENGMLHSQWSTPAETAITAASSNLRHLAVSIGGIEAIIFNLERDLQVVSRRSFLHEGQIACIHVPSIIPDICFVGFWQSATVSILKSSNLETVQRIVISEDAISVPRSILLAQMLPCNPPTLFIAMANGEVITFFVDPSGFKLISKKAVVLGTQQANFKILPQSNGLDHIFATCEHPSLIHASEGRIIYSAITAEKASCVCLFDSEAYPGSIAIATAKDLRIAVVDKERTTHVQTLPVHETVRRVAYSPLHKAFGLGTIKRTLRNGSEIIQSRFKLADEVLFKELHTFNLNEEELVESVMVADLRDAIDFSDERFVVGTAYLDEHEVQENGNGKDSRDPHRGRIIVLAVNFDRQLQVIAELPVKGACRALGVVDGIIVAALIKTVCLVAGEKKAVLWKHTNTLFRSFSIAFPQTPSRKLLRIVPQPHPWILL